MSQEEKPQPQKSENPAPKGESQPSGRARQERERRRPANNGFRLQNLKCIQVNRKHQEMRGRAQLMSEVSHAVFGRRRFKRIELTCSLNILFAALKICSIIHKGVAGMYMIVQLKKVHYTQFQDENDEKGTQKEHSLFQLVLTRFPTEEDRKSYGFHEAFKAEDIKNPFKMPERRRKGNRGEGRRDQRDRRDRRDQRDYRDRRDRRNRQQREQQRRDRYQEGDKRRRQKRERDEEENRQKRYVSKKGEEQREPDSRDKSSYRKTDNNDRKAKQYDRSDRQERGERQERDRQQGGQYQRGDKKSRGAGKVSQPTYDQSHLKEETKASKTEDRGERAPPRKNRYVDQEDW